MAYLWLEGVKSIWFVETEYNPQKIVLKICHIANNRSTAITNLTLGDCFNKYNTVDFSLVFKGKVSGVISLPVCVFP